MRKKELKIDVAKPLTSLCKFKYERMPFWVADFERYKECLQRRNTIAEKVKFIEEHTSTFSYIVKGYAQIRKELVELDLSEYDKICDTVSVFIFHRDLNTLYKNWFSDGKFADNNVLNICEPNIGKMCTFLEKHYNKLLYNKLANDT